MSFEKNIIDKHITVRYVTVRDIRKIKVPSITNIKNLKKYVTILSFFNLIDERAVKK